MYERKKMNTSHRREKIKYEKFFGEEMNERVRKELKVVEKLFSECINGKG